MSSKIEIIMCVYNGETYLRAALDSLLADPFCQENNILCFVDEGSSDQSAAIAQSYGSSIRYIASERCGIAAARNRAIALTESPFIAFFDADDLWIQGGLKSRIQILENADHQTGICFGGFRELRRDVKNPAQFVCGQEIRQAVCPGTALIRRGVFEKCGGFNETLTTAYFMEWYSRVQAAGLKACFAEGFVIERRIHDTNSGIVERARFQQEHMQVLREHLKRKRSQDAGT